MTRQIFGRVKGPLFIIVLFLILVGVFINAQRTLAKSSLSSQCPKCHQVSQDDLVNYNNPIYYFTIFTLGVFAGLSPCLIALTSFIVVPALYSWKSPKGALKKLIAIAVGVFYFHTIIAYLFVPLELYTKDLIIPLAVGLAIFGSVHFIEVFHDVYKSKWRNGGNPIVPLFRTPRMLKEFIQKISLQENLYISFLVGMLFSLVKSSCTVSMLFVIPLIPPFQSIIGVTVFNIGVIFPMLVLGLFLCAGLLTVHQLQELRLRGRVLQRTIVGTALIVAAFFVLLQVM